MSDTMPCPSSKVPIGRCVMQEVDAEAASLQQEGFSSFPFYGPADAPLTSARHNAEQERSRDLFLGQMGQATCIRAQCLVALDTGHRNELVKLAAMVVAAIESVDENQ